VTTHATLSSAPGLLVGADWDAAHVGSPHPLDNYPLDATYGDHFTGSSLNAAWTRRNYVAGDETYQVGPDASSIRIAKAGQAAGDGYFRPAPGGDWTFMMSFVPRFFAGSGTSFSWGIGCVDTNGTGVATCVYGGPIAPLGVRITTYSTYQGTYVQPGATGTNPNISVWTNTVALDRKYWVTLRKASTNYFTAVSLDGQVWSPESDALAATFTVDRMAMMDAPLGTITSGVGTGSYVDVDVFNKIA
jgi:hypothetical protein